MENFKTPVKRIQNPSVLETPFSVPPSPFLKQLGYGTGVSVLQMVRSPKVGKIRSPWAIKRVNKKKMESSIYGKRLKVEADILRKMNHPNVVGFRRFTKMDDGRSCLAMESCGDSLGDLIATRSEQGLEPYSPKTILKVALDISKALDYIHTKVKILHGDVKSFNILINGDFEICKLCDFGVSVPINENGQTSDCYVGTECWSAPEVLNGCGLITSKADLFSYGLTLWEMMALEPPHIDNIIEDSMDDSVILVDDSMDEDPTAFYGTRPALPEIDQIIYQEVLTIFYCTTEEKPEQRPSAFHITLCVEDMLKNVNFS